MITGSRAKRLNLEEIELSYTSEKLLIKIFGQNMQYIHGPLNEKRWKRILTKLNKSLKSAFEVNVQTDSFHHHCIISKLSKIDDAIHSNDNEDIEIILQLYATIFELLGQLPDNSKLKIVNKKQHFFLNGMRKIYYFQTDFQKVRTILTASKNEPFSYTHSYDELFNFYIYECNQNAKKFLDWYKNSYPQIYCSIF